MATVSYAGMTNKELSSLWRQWQGSKGRVRCEAGHEGCGCSRDRTQDGIAPCRLEVEREMIWRGKMEMDE